MQKKSRIIWMIEALHDFEDYIDWYLINAGVVVAERFVTAIEHAIDVIAENNFITRMVDEIPELRECVVQNFPFLISYWVKNDKEIMTTSFLHQKLKK